MSSGSQQRQNLYIMKEVNKTSQVCLSCDERKKINVEIFEK